MGAIPLMSYSKNRTINTHERLCLRPSILPFLQLKGTN